MTSALACWLLWLLVRPGPAAQPRRPESRRLATATAIYGDGGNFLQLATAYELYGGLRRRLGGLNGTDSVNTVLESVICCCQDLKTNNSKSLKTYSVEIC